ncbi:MAG: ubiquinone/menaquinone biosynthesis C-methylase UbiE [Myxococcota bacterium]|jgi:ubiquinone/menaquinone biosynthesis C-methylase UbiE
MFTLLALLFACSTPTQAEEYMGRNIAQTMSYRGAPWLIRPERVEEENPALLLANLGLVDGEVACDIGAGNGYYSLPMAELVGDTGRVVATDIQPEMLTLLEQRASDASVGNITRVLSSETDAALPANTCDVVLLVDVYHEFSDPEAMLRGIRESLTPTGRVALVEYRAEDPAVPMRPLHKMTIDQADREYLANGFARVGQFDGLPWQHVLFYGRADAE